MKRNIAIIIMVLCIFLVTGAIHLLGRKNEIAAIPGDAVSWRVRSTDPDEIALNAVLLAQEIELDRDMFESAQILGEAGIREIVSMEAERIEIGPWEHGYCYNVKVSDIKKKNYNFTISRWGIGHIRKGHEDGKVIWAQPPE